MGVKLGKQTFAFSKPIYYTGAYSVVGAKEGEGPLGKGFDVIMPDCKWGEDSFEKAERKMFKTAMEGCVQSAGVNMNQVDMVIGGDLLNQIISASFAVKDYEGSYVGVYGACSTMAESMLVGGCMIDGGFADKTVCVTSSHFCSAERQYRFPLEMGTQRTPTAQWTVTGAGGALLSSEGRGPVLESGTFGTVIDMGVSDANNMGAAMAPAASSTICAHFEATKTTPQDYDLILTGDLGMLGKKITLELVRRSGYELEGKIEDCGCLIFDESQDVHMGGSGCGCSASVLNSEIYRKLRNGTYKKILFIATGALLSLTSSMQGDSVPSIAHAVCIRGENA
jgi:stage V sporulation protein AD